MGRERRDSGEGRARREEATEDVHTLLTKTLDPPLSKTCQWIRLH